MRTSNLISGSSLFAGRHGALAALLLCTVLAGGCAPQHAAPDPAMETREPAPTGPLAASLQAESLNDSVRFSLRVTNASDQPVPLTFPTGQSFDFHVYEDGRQIWRWSDDMMFTQAIRHETLAPGETREYEATWTPPPTARGEFTLRGYLTAQEHRLDQQTRFHVR